MRSASETISVGALTIHFLVEGSESNGSVSTFECEVPAGARVPAPHSHDAFEETIYGLRGGSTFTVDGETVEIGPGEALCVPRGTIHGFENRGDADSSFLAIATPGVFGASYFRELADVLALAGGGPPDHAAIADIMRRHGLTPAAPART
jgi:quercetin dioxygenase-like cupin family protein